MVEADRHSQFLRGSLDMCLLALLSQRPSHAYELSARLEQRGLDGVGYGTLYPLVTRLRRLGMLEQDVQPGDSGPPRKVYRPSDEGARALAAWAADWWASASVVHDLLVDTGVLPVPAPAAPAPAPVAPGGAP